MLQNTPASRPLPVARERPAGAKPASWVCAGRNFFPLVAIDPRSGIAGRSASGHDRSCRDLGAANRPVTPAVVFALGRVTGMRHNDTVIVFAREPRVGRVKTRLAAEIGGVTATFWYRRQLAALLRRLSGPEPWRRFLYVTPPTATRAAFWPRNWGIRAQTGRDLGDRMHRALSMPGPGRVILVGSDIPALRSFHVREAFRALGRADVVLGPAEDGGYWLIGMRRRQRPPRFAAVRWSTRHALADTIAGFPDRTAVVVLATRLADIDTGSDWRAGEIRNRGRRFHAP